jgi:hypothetical protein
MTSLLPYWITTPLSPLASTSDLAPSAIAKLAQDAKNVATTGLPAITSLDAQRASVTSRLRAWYDEQQRPPTPVEQWTQSAQDALAGLWSTGLYYRVLRPQPGGFGQLQRTLSRALQPSGVADAPRFPEAHHVGGLLLVFSGQPEVLFDAAKVLLLMLSGSVPYARTALADMLLADSLMEPLEDALLRAAYLPAAQRSQEIAEWQERFETSAANRLLSEPENFPFNLAFEAAPRIQGFSPKAVTVDQPATLVIRGVGLRETDRAQIGDRYFEVEFTPEGHMQFAVPTEGLTPGTYPVQVRRGATRFPVGELKVNDRPLGQQLQRLNDASTWDVWRAVTVGDSLNTLLPGVSVLYEATLTALDATGQIAAAYDEAGRAFGTLPNMIQQAFNEDAARRPDTTQQRQEVLQTQTEAYDALLAEIQRLTAATLVIPPCAGGNHQLNFALQQGLSSFAANAPDIQPTDGTLAVFFCAGAPDPGVVRGTLNTVAQVLKLGNWPGL